MATYTHTTGIHTKANAPSDTKTYVYNLCNILRIGEHIKQSLYVIQPRDQVQWHKSPYTFTIGETSSFTERNIEKFAENI